MGYSRSDNNSRSDSSRSGINSRRSDNNSTGNRRKTEKEKREQTKAFFEKREKQPFYQRQLKGRTGAQPGDYVVITDGKKNVTTRINLKNHPFAGREVGDRVSIKGQDWYLKRILYEGTRAYTEVYDADTERENFGY